MAAADVECSAKWRKIPSGALHDAANVSKITNGNGIYSSIDGVSHDFSEDTNEADLIAGLRVLAGALGKGF